MTVAPVVAEACHVHDLVAVGDRHGGAGNGGGVDLLAEEPVHGGDVHGCVVHGRGGDRLPTGGRPDHNGSERRQDQERGTDTGRDADQPAPPLSLCHDAGAVSPSGRVHVHVVSPRLPRSGLWVKELSACPLSGRCPIAGFRGVPSPESATGLGGHENPLRRVPLCNPRWSGPRVLQRRPVRRKRPAAPAVLTQRPRDIPEPGGHLAHAASATHAIDVQGQLGYLPTPFTGPEHHRRRCPDAVRSGGWRC